MNGKINCTIPDDMLAELDRVGRRGEFETCLLGLGLVKPLGTPWAYEIDTEKMRGWIYKEWIGEVLVRA